jgi:hypothetical protein
MKKIIACVKIQNESDIIESLCRYYCAFCDGIVVTDNMSSDNTRDILQAMVDEGLPVYITNSEEVDLGLPGVKVRQQQLLFAVDHFDADIILPIDADEFLFVKDGGNPRPILESLEETVEYHIKCYNYICPLPPADNTKFFPAYSDHYNIETGDFGKTVMSRYLIKEKKAYPVPGSHSFLYPNEPTPPAILNEDRLGYAHYAVRSETHLMTKAIPGWLNQLCWPGREMSIRYFYAWNWRRLYDELKTRGTISQELLEYYSLNYNNGNFLDKNSWLNAKPEDIKTVTAPIDTFFCGDKLILRYTDYNANKKYVLQIILKQLEINLLNMPSWRTAMERDVANEQNAYANATIKSLNDYIAILCNQITGLTQANAALNTLNTSLGDVYSSWSWRLGHAIVCFVSKFIPWKKRKR